MIYRIVRERRTGAKSETEVSYGIASRARPDCDAAAMLAGNRGHWGIENGLHDRRDVTLGEDAGRIRKGNAGQLMACLRNLVIFVVDRLGHESLPTAIRHYMCHYQKSVDLLSRPI